MQNIPKVFIFLGRSGCGKGTQADLMMSRLSAESDKLNKTLHVESGVLLREFGKGDSYTNQRIKETIEAGGLSPEAIIVALWTNYLINNFTGQENIVFDGCPRKLHEAQLLESVLRFYDFDKPSVIFLDVSREWSEKRLVGRARKDDSPDAISKRLAWFDTEVMPTIKFFENNPYFNFVKINGEQPIDQVRNEIISKLGMNL